MTSTDGHGGSCGCTTCAIAPFTRNNYFTGKLLLERDFTDEQQYFRDKIRHHNQRLHGSGVVCGLIVSQHPAAGCRDRFVRLGPGTAVDCCGNEILVVEEQDIDLTTLPAWADVPDDGKPHDVRLCLRYHECGDELIPVLYDDCAWDDERCQPNRILEGWRLDAVVDPPIVGPVWRGPTLTRVRDVPLDDASAVVELGSGAIAVADGTRVHRVEAAAPTPTTTTDLGGRVYGLERAVGGRLYATHDDGAGALTVSVLEAADLAVAHAEAVAGSAAPATTALAADGRLLVLQPKSGTLTVYGTDLEAGAPAAPASVTVDADRALLAAHPTSGTAYLAAAPDSADATPERVDAVDLDAATVAPFATLDARPTAIRAVTVPTGAALVVARADGVVARLDLTTGTVDDDVTVAGTVIAIGDGEWSYLLTGDAVTWHVAPLSVERLGAGTGPGIGVEGVGRAVVVAADGETVYVAHTAAAAAPDPGGVVVLDVSMASCREQWDGLPTCPACDTADCVGIATIRGYRPGFAVLDPEDPPPAPDDDDAAERARIDNVLGRDRLRSTAELEDAIDALFGGCGGGGGAGERGPKGDKGDKGDPGPRGPRGPAGADGADGAPGADGTNGTDGTDGTNGADGEGLEKDLTQIIAMSWHHAQRMLVQDLEMIVDPLTGEGFFGLVIQFSREVFVKPLDAEHVFTVEAPNPFAPDEAERWFRCRCAVRGEVVPVAVISRDASGRIDKAEVLSGAGTADAIAFLLDRDFVNAVLLERSLDDLWVRLQGEFVVDIDQRAVDAEFTRAELPSGDRPSGSAFGVQGGLFQSWFEPTRG